MTTLTVWKFDSESGARGALQVLERLQKEELLQVVDAAIVTWPPDRKKPKTEQLRGLGGYLPHPVAQQFERRQSSPAARGGAEYKKLSQEDLPCGVPRTRSS